jgi:hypothetical protein
MKLCFQNSDLLEVNPDGQNCKYAKVGSLFTGILRFHMQYDQYTDVCGHIYIE